MQLNAIQSAPKSRKSLRLRQRFLLLHQTIAGLFEASRCRISLRSGIANKQRLVTVLRVLIFLRLLKRNRPPAIVENIAFCHLLLLCALRPVLFRPVLWYANWSMQPQRSWLGSYLQYGLWMKSGSKRLAICGHSRKGTKVFISMHAAGDGASATQWQWSLATSIMLTISAVCMFCMWVESPLQETCAAWCTMRSWRMLGYPNNFLARTIRPCKFPT